MSKITSLANLIRRRKKIFALLILVLIIIFIGFMFKSRNSKTVETAIVKRGDLKEELALSGDIDATEKAALFFPVSGKISWIGVKEGDLVKQGQALATLDQSSVLKSFQSAMLDYSKQRNTFEQTKVDEGASNPVTAPNDEIRRILENNQFDLEKSVLAVELKDIARRDSVINAPFEGLIAAKSNYYVGNNIALGTSLFQIVNPKTIYFSVQADQTEVVLLSEGEKCEITLDSFEGKKITGEIKQISFIPTEGESGTVYKIEVSIDGDVSDFRIGMSGDATFVIDQISNALYIPSKFVKSDENGSYVLSGKKKEKIYIKTGLETDENTEIKSGLKEGDLVYD